MSIKSTMAAITLAATSFFAAPAVEASLENTSIRTGRVADFHVVVTDTPEWDTIVVPLESSFPGVVLVRCATGEYRFNGEIGRASAERIAISFCN